jgi:hypothetical protein
MTQRVAVALAATALLVALLGATPVAGAVERLVLPKNAVGTAQLKPGAVTSVKVKNGSLLKADFKAGQLPAGPAGPAGPKGDKGDRGEAGATNVAFRRAQTDLAGGGIWTAVAECGPGERLIGGGGVVVNPLDDPAYHQPYTLVASYPAADGANAADAGDTPRRWIAAAEAPQGSTARIVAYAICARP